MILEATRSMHWFLKIFILPLLDALRPAVIVEVGVELGTVTRPLLTWADANDAVLHSIDPNPKLEVDELLAEHPERLRFHRVPSLEILSSIEGVDLALIDGDHNWYTVINELRQLVGQAERAGRTPPVILLHDIGWPYGRRDLYYNPDTIPVAYRQPHARQGIVPGESELGGQGINSHLENARLEDTPANGVLTAVEDFLAESSARWHFYSIPGLSGLGVLLTDATREHVEPLRRLLDSIDSPEFLRAQSTAIESARLESEVRRARLTATLAETKRQLRVLDPGEFVELRDRAVALAEQLRVVSELEEQLRASLKDSASSALNTLAPGDGLEAVECEDPLPLPERRRLQLAIATRDHLQGRLDETRATLTAQLRAADEETEEARRALALLRSELSELKVELELSDTQRRRLQSALARTRADMEVADGEREALERHLHELTAAHADGVEGEAASEAPARGAELTQELAATREERDELTHALAQLQARGPEGSRWQRELELRGLEAFLDAYLGVLAHCAPAHDGRDPLSLPLPTDRHDLLCAENEIQEPDRPTVDVVVCVHDALQDIRRCLSSLLNATERRFRLIVVDDGSAEPTATLLADLAGRYPAITLIHRADPPHGYTLAANAGLRASTSDYVVLLNSDTILTPGWLARLVDHGERHAQLGILGPLSNAASHQSVPELRHEGAWAVNPLPDWLTVEGMARIVQLAAPRVDARLPFINGFCYVIKRGVIDAIGYLDEEHFAGGYCEENDYSHRAYKRGYQLGVAADAYVYHAKSRSFGSDARNDRARRNYQTFLDKHDRVELQELVRGMEANPVLEPVRHAVANASSSPQAMASLMTGEEHRPLEVVFVLPGLADGGSGGSHSIYQEVRGMRELGIPARIALHTKAWERAQAAYEDAAEVFEVFADTEELAANTARADVISATHFKSVALLSELYRLRQDFLPAYYVQDYEPFITAPGSEDAREALASYTALPELVLFAKTDWLCNIVGACHDVPVHRVQPSIDERLFFPAPTAGRAREHDRLRVIAMVRPRTPRRQPAGTVAVLERLAAEFPERVEVSSFGCRHTELARLTRSRAIVAGHLGVLSRADVAEQLRGCDVFLDMSTYQAFGRSALEAMACGATAVVPQLGGAWEFVEDGVNALAVDTLDPSTVFHAVAALADDRERVARLQSAARETGARFSIVRAALSEYLLFEREHRRHVGAARRIAAREDFSPYEEPATPFTTPTIAA